MEREQRFNLAISLQNLKQNKYFVVLVITILSLLGFYLGYPLILVQKTSSIADTNLSFLTDLLEPPIFNVSQTDLLSRPTGHEPVKWGFDSLTPTTCTEDHVVNLGSGTYLSVCNYEGNIVIDIRKFTGNPKLGIKPTIVGIGLHLNQWKVLTEHISIINVYVNNLS